jgi:hypothetical protein
MAGQPGQPWGGLYIMNNLQSHSTALRKVLLLHKTGHAQARAKPDMAATAEDELRIDNELADIEAFLSKQSFSITGPVTVGTAGELSIWAFQTGYNDPTDPATFVDWVIEASDTL